MTCLYLLQAIDGVKSCADHKPLDIIVLLILHSNNYKKPVESLIRNKIRAAKFTEGLLQATFSSHCEVRLTSLINMIFYL